MSSLAKQAVTGWLQFQVALGLMLFLPAWNWHDGRVWAFWGVVAGSTLGITLYFLKHSPDLIRRRLEVGSQAEPLRSQKIIQAVSGLLCCLLVILPGVDRRFHWSNVPAPVSRGALALVLVGLVVIFLAFLHNSHAAATVRVDADQPVISSGLYGLVRHPMYSGATLAFLATPVALGSYATLPVALLLCGSLIVRLLDEERFLAISLTGYRDYQAKVRSRLIPFVW